LGGANRCGAHKCQAQQNWSISYTPTGGTVGYCAYGTQRKPGVTDIISISTGLLGSMGLITLSPWVLPFLVAEILSLP
jgi:hypothetical protein